MKKICFFILLFFNLLIIRATEIVHFSFINEKIYLNEVIINEEKISGLFLIDIGSDITLLNTKKIKNFDRGKERENVNTYYGTLKTVIQPTKLGIGSKNFGEINVGYTEGYIFSESCFVNEIVGIIGRDLLSKSNWKFDLQKQKIEISDTPFETINYVPFPIIKKGKFSKFFVEVLFQKKKRRLLLDTGSNVKISLKENKRSAVKKYSVFGSKIDCVSYEDGIISVQEQDFYTNIVFSKYLKPSMGMGFLKNFEWILNKNDNYIYLLKQTEYIAKKEEIRYGFSVMIDEGKLIVSDIYAESIAQKMGLNLFDEIIDVNNISTLNPDCSILDTIEKEFTKQEMCITLKNNKKITLSL